MGNFQMKGIDRRKAAMAAAALCGIVVRELEGGEFWVNCGFRSSCILLSIRTQALSSNGLTNISKFKIRLESYLLHCLLRNSFTNRIITIEDCSGIFGVWGSVGPPDSRDSIQNT